MKLALLQALGVATGGLFALGLGVLVTVLNVKNLAIYLSAISILAAAELSASEASLAVLATAGLFCAGVLSPLLVYALTPRRSASGWPRPDAGSRPTATPSPAWSCPCSA